MAVNQTMSVLTSQLVYVPLFLVYAVGAVLSVVYGRRFPKPALFALIGFSMLLANLVVGIIVMLWQMQAVNEGAEGIQSIAQVIGIIGLGRTLSSAAAHACLIVAIFGWRRAPEYDVDDA